jgi:apolipoprotein D and lipocalin family protein
MKKLIVVLSLLLSNLLYASNLPTAENVDVSRFVGKWYAHYSLPQFFTRKCLGQTAEYEVVDFKTISVLNTCLKGKASTTIEGQAVITNPGDNSELIVTFNNFFTRLFKVKGDYNIVKLDDNYEYVLVATNNRKSLWLMSRAEIELPDSVKDEYLKLAKDLGFNVNKLVKSNF